MTEHTVGHVLKAITYYHLLQKICTCGTIRGCATIKINYENKVICTRIVTQWATIRICATNRVNMVILILKHLHMFDGGILKILSIINWKKLIII